MNGCICCTVRGDLVEALKRLHKRVDQFDGIIIETTGLADSAPVVQTFFVDETIQEMYSLDAVITVVDAKELLNIQAFDLQRVLDFEPDFLEEDGEHAHDNRVSSISCRVKGNVNQMMLSRWISRLIQEDGANLYRYKG